MRQLLYRWGMPRKISGLSGLMELASGFMASKTLLAAVDLELFGMLSEKALSAEVLASRAGLAERGARDFLDALVSMGLLDREEGLYENSECARAFLDPNAPSYVGGAFKMFNRRTYPLWARLEEGLKSGRPQVGAENGLFEQLYSTNGEKRDFIRAMANTTKPSACKMATCFPWGDYKTICDMGTSAGAFPIEILRVHPHLRGIGFDLASVEPDFLHAVGQSGLSERLEFRNGDFFSSDPWPDTDVFVFGRILHDWDVSTRKELLQRAFSSLSTGGAVIVYGSLIDDLREAATFGMLMSLNMLMQTDGGGDYTIGECQTWLSEAGFSGVFGRTLTATESMVVGFKAAHAPTRRNQQEGII